jgi:dTDP-4-amino-4,6-dideoxygalactose transaminase
VIVPFNDVSRLNARYSANIRSAIDSVLRSGELILGSVVDSFETEFARFCGTEGSVGVANATDGLEIALRAAGCGSGSEVIVAGNAGGYSTVAAIAIGATPVFADVDPRTLLIDAESVVSVISDRTRAVIVTHLYGGVVDVERLRGMLPERIIIIEDGSQAHGARINDSSVGSLGDLAVFSFYPTKNLGAVGDAGAVTGRNSELLDAVRELRQYGWGSRYRINRAFGRNSRLDPVQAATLLVKIADVGAVNSERIRIADCIATESGHVDSFVHRAFGDDVIHAGHLCVITHPDRDSFARRLAARGVPTAVHFPTADHLQAPLKDLVMIRNPLHATELACSRVLSLPCFPGMTEEERHVIVEAVRTEW